MEIQSTIAINFISFKDIDEVIHSKSDNIKIITYDKADKVIKELFESLLERYWIGWGISMKGSDFDFDCTDLLNYKSW